MGILVKFSLSHFISNYKEDEQTKKRGDMDDKRTATTSLSCLSYPVNFGQNLNILDRFVELVRRYVDAGIQLAPIEGNTPFGYYKTKSRGRKKTGTKKYNLKWIRKIKIQPN